jgi:hypothetical protein
LLYRHNGDAHDDDTTRRYWDGSRARKNHWRRRRATVADQRVGGYATRGVCCAGMMRPPRWSTKRGGPGASCRCCRRHRCVVIFRAQVALAAMHMDGKEGLCIAARTVGFAANLSCSHGNLNKKLVVHYIHARVNYSLKFGLCWFVVRGKHCAFAEKYYWGWAPQI